MDIQELFSMAKAANTKAQIKILMSEDAICIRWIYDHAFGPEWRRNLPMSALGSDRDPYRAVREYIKMDALYMEGRGGTPDRTHNLFGTTAPASTIKPMRGPKIPPMRTSSVTVNVSGFAPAYARKDMKMVPVLEVTPADLFPGDVVETGINAAETVKGVGRLGNDYDVFWVSGGSNRFAADDKLRIVRPGRSRGN